MKVSGALALLLLGLAALPAGSAQMPQGVTITPGELAAPIPYEGSAQLPVTVRVGCLSLLQGGSTTVTVDAADPQPWLTVTPAEIPIEASACVGGAGFATGTGEVGLAVSKDAPGVVDHTVNLTADLGGDPAPAVFTVAYHVNYTLVPDVAFPLAVNGTEASFNVTVTQASNARSMVMMEQLQVSAGALSGLVSQPYESAAGQPVSKTLKFTYKAPATEWSNATATFTAFSHYLLTDGRAGEFKTGCAALALPTCDVTGTQVTFTFTNAAEPAGDGGEKKSPAPAVPLMALGLVALAVLARRR